MNIIIHSLMFSISPPCHDFPKLLFSLEFPVLVPGLTILQSNQFEFQLYFIYSPLPITLHASQLQHQKVVNFSLYSVLLSTQLFSSPASRSKPLPFFMCTGFCTFISTFTRTSFNFLYIFDDLSFIKQMKH